MISIEIKDERMKKHFKQILKTKHKRVKSHYTDKGINYPKRYNVYKYYAYKIGPQIYKAKKTH